MKEEESSMKIIQKDIFDFIAEYTGSLFHALICDAPYHLTSITNRFKNTSPNDDTKTSQRVRNRTDGFARLVGTGFMGTLWDGGDIAFRPETWKAFWDILYPGAFCMTFGGSRTAHRMATAIEDAGYIIHPMMGWVYGQGFPKAHKVKDNNALSGHYYGLQALKPAFEPIIVFQKPYEGRPVDDITRTGAGALNIDGGRIGNEVLSEQVAGQSRIGTFERENMITPKRNGRWPSNFIIQHSLDCKQIGTSPDGYTINRFTDGAKPFGDAVGEKFEGKEIKGESMVWECVEGCPALELGEKSKFFFNSDYTQELLENSVPFKYQAKAPGKEKEAGLVHYIPCAKCGELDSISHVNDKGKDEKCKRCTHPTIKPIALSKHLATLLLPPDEYTPRRLFVPFMGTGSEMIGAYQAGWDDIVGVEKEIEYTKIAEARINYWIQRRYSEKQF